MWLCESCLPENKVMTQESKETLVDSDDVKTLVSYLTTKALSIDPNLAVFYVPRSSNTPFNVAQQSVPRNVEVSDKIWQKTYALAELIRKTIATQKGKNPGFTDVVMVVRAGNLYHTGTSGPDMIRIHCCGCVPVKNPTSFDFTQITWDQVTMAIPGLSDHINQCGCQSGAKVISHDQSAGDQDGTQAATPVTHQV